MAGGKSDETLRQLLANTREREIDCDEFLARVAAFIEGSPDALVEQHVLICPECQEELDALRRALGLE